MTVPPVTRVLYSSKSVSTPPSHASTCQAHTLNRPWRVGDRDTPGFSIRPILMGSTRGVTFNWLLDYMFCTARLCNNTFSHLFKWVASAFARTGVRQVVNQVVFQQWNLLVQVSIYFSYGLLKCLLSELASSISSLSDIKQCVSMLMLWKTRRFTMVMGTR